MTSHLIPSEVRAWAIKNRYFEWSAKKRPGVKESHRMLDGGNLYVPPHKMDEFFAEYVSSLQKNQQLFITETTTPIFKLFIDLDFCNPEAIREEKIMDYCKFIQGIVGEFLNNIYSVQERMTIVSVSPPKEKEKNKAIYQANGIHMNWPNVLVNIHDAFLLRKAVIYALETQYGRRPFYNTWEQVVDESIYIHGGLRMIGSQKTKLCPECKNKDSKRSSCEACSAFGKIIYPHIYKMVAVIDGHEQAMPEYFAELERNPLKMVKDTSIKSFETETGHPNLITLATLPSWFPSKLSKNDMKEISDGQPVKKRRRIVEPPGQEDIDGMSQFSSNRIPIYSNDKRFQEVKRFINAHLPTQYTDCIVELNRCAGGAYYVVRTDSHMCMNFKDAPSRTHTNNTIYFYLSPEHCYQKCFCTCDSVEGRLHGKCSDYRSSGYPLPPKLRKLLFSDSEVKQNGNVAHGFASNSAVILTVNNTPDFKKAYISLKTRSGSELLRRENRIRALDDLLDKLVEKASGKKEYEQRKFRFKKDNNNNSN